MVSVALVAGLLLAVILALVVSNEIVGLIRTEGIPGRVKFFFMLAGIIYCLMAVVVIFQIASQA